MNSTRSGFLTACLLALLLQASAARRGLSSTPTRGAPTIPGYGNVPGFTIPGVPGGGGFIPGYGNPPKGWTGGYGGGYSTPSGSRSFGGVTRPSAPTVCRNKGPCYGKKLTCPAKCYKTWSKSGKGYGGGGGSGGCTIDCKKCVAYC